MARNSLLCADVLLRNYSLTHAARVSLLTYEKPLVTQADHQDGKIKKYKVKHENSPDIFSFVSLTD